MRAFLLLGDIFIHAVAENVSSIVATWEGRYILDFSSIFHRFLFNTSYSTKIGHLSSYKSFTGSLEFILCRSKYFSNK